VKIVRVTLQKKSEPDRGQVRSSESAPQRLEEPSGSRVDILRIGDRVVIEREGAGFKPGPVVRIIICSPSYHRPSRWSCR